MAMFKDINRDGYLDMVVPIYIEELGLVPLNITAVLSAKTFANAPYYGVPIKGSDSILIVK